MGLRLVINHTKMTIDRPDLMDVRVMMSHIEIYPENMQLNANLLHHILNMPIICIPTHFSYATLLTASFPSHRRPFIHVIFVTFQEIGLTMQLQILHRLTSAVALAISHKPLRSL